MLWVDIASSTALFEEFVSSIIVIGKSDVGPCACMVGISDIAKES
jgi:hypothetical protein